MKEQIQKKLNDSKVLRWSVLALVAFTMLCGYFLTDVMSPLKPMLEKELLWDSLDYGIFTSAYGWFNVFAFMLIIGGIILDKMGVRFTGMGACLLMVLGCGLKYYAISTTFAEGSTLLGMKTQVGMAALGYAIFGVGVEIAGITVSKIIVKWFKGKEMALAMGVEMAIARVGVAVVVLGSPVLANKISPIDVSRPVLVAVILLAIGLICFITYAFMDKKLEQQMGESGEEKDDPFKLKDLKLIFSSKVFWLVALLCVLYYSAIFPFQKYAINMLQCNLGYTAEQAGWVFFVFPLGAAAITPILGNFLDHRGKGATMLIFGALLMIACHLVFALVLPALKGTTAAVIVAYLSIILLGISFSLVPASLWPSVPKLVDNKLLGSAYAVIFWIQNIGLYAFPMIIGAALRISNPGITDPLQYNYTTPMLIFASLGVLALLFGLWLKVEDKKRGYGLELPNIQK